MARQPEFWDIEECLKEISEDDDSLETLAGAADFQRFRPVLERTAGKPSARKATAGPRSRRKRKIMRLSEASIRLIPFIEPSRHLALHGDCQSTSLVSNDPLVTALRNDCSVVV